MPGRVNLDQFVYFTVEFTSEASYALDHFAKKICNDQKKPMPYTEIVPAQNEGPNGRGRLANYCLHDCVLLYELDEACKVTLGTVVMARTVRVTPEQVYFRGQQVRYVAQLLHVCRGRAAQCGHAQLLDEPPEGFLVRYTGKYVGATVNAPLSGFYKKPVAVLDWASLYPSIMMAFNLSHDTCVRRPELQQRDDVVAIEVSEDETKWYVSSSDTLSLIHI